MLTLRTLFLSLHVSGGVLGLLLGAFACVHHRLRRLAC